MKTCVFFRVDASREMGGGHLSRCLALADCIAARGASAHFLCSPLASPYEEQITVRGHRLSVVGSDIAASADAPSWVVQDADHCARALADCRTAQRILVVDHYSIDARWERLMRPHASKIVVIDDLANRPHDCDLLVDQGYTSDTGRYAGLVPDECLCLLGTRYALLRPEFAEWREKRIGSTHDLRFSIVHVFFGSEDNRANTVRFAGLLLQVEQALELRVAVSPRFSETDALEDLRRLSGGRLTWERVGARMAEHMAGCDVAIGAPGQSTWERACLGLPALYVAISENQVPILQRLRESGLCAYLDTDRNLSDEKFRAGCSAFLSDGPALRGMRQISLAAVDGLGCARVADQFGSALA